MRIFNCLKQATEESTNVYTPGVTTEILGHMTGMRHFINDQKRRVLLNAPRYFVNGKIRQELHGLLEAVLISKESKLSKVTLLTELKCARK